MRRIDGRRLAVDLLVDVASGLLVGASTYQFAYAANFAPGGLVGLTLILYHLTGFPMGWATLLLNIPIVLVSWRVMGVGFLLRSLKTMVVASLVLDYVLPHVPVFTGPALALLRDDRGCWPGWGTHRLRPGLVHRGDRFSHRPAQPAVSPVFPWAASSLWWTGWSSCWGRWSFPPGWRWPMA